MSQSQVCIVRKASEKRKKQYRKLLDQAEILEIEETKGVETAKAIDRILATANSLFHQSEEEDVNYVNVTDETLLDAKVLATTTSILFSLAEVIDAGVDTYDSVDFANRIKRKFLSNNDETQYDELKWLNMFDISNQIIKKPINYSYMGTFLIEQEIKPPKEKKARLKKDKNEQVSKKQPETIAKVNQEEDSIDDTVKFLYWSLNKEFNKNEEKPINYFTFVIDPNNFTHSVENMFHLSFLIRDGRIKFGKDKSGLLVVSPLSSSESKRIVKDGLPFKQYVMPMDTELWQKAIRAFNIKSYFLDKWRPKWEERKKHHV